MAVEVDGDGDAVLMLHGLGGTSNTFTAIEPAFARMKRVRFDLPGSGRSDRVEGALSIARYVKPRCACWLRPASRARTWSPIRWARSSRRISPRCTPRSCAASRCSARCSRRRTRRGPACARAAEKARSEGGMQDIADALVQASTSASTKAQRRAAVAYRARVADAPAARRLRALVPRAGRCAKPPMPRASRARRCWSPATRTWWRRLRPCARWARRSPPAAPTVAVEVLRGCGHWTPIEMPDECAQLLRDHYARRIP